MNRRTDYTSAFRRRDEQPFARYSESVAWFFLWNPEESDSGPWAWEGVGRLACLLSEDIVADAVVGELRQAVIGVRVERVMMSSTVFWHYEPFHGASTCRDFRLMSRQMDLVVGPLRPNNDMTNNFSVSPKHLWNSMTLCRSSTVRRLYCL